MARSGMSKQDRHVRKLYREALRLGLDVTLQEVQRAPESWESKIYYATMRKQREEDS